MNEHYNKILLADARNVADQITRKFDLDRIMLFGSGARGEARQSSDLDILLVGDSMLSYKERKTAPYTAVDPLRDTDMLWYTPAEIGRMMKAGNSFIRHIMSTVFWMRWYKCKHESDRRDAKAGRNRSAIEGSTISAG